MLGKREAPEDPEPAEQQSKQFRVNFVTVGPDGFLEQRLSPQVLETIRSAALESVHPLIQLQADVDGMLAGDDSTSVKDHGSWHCAWSLPSRGQFQLLHQLQDTLPSGDGYEKDVRLVQTSRKEINWSQLNEPQRVLYRKAAAEQWQTWLDNGAV